MQRITRVVHEINAHVNTLGDGLLECNPVHMQNIACFLSQNSPCLGDYKPITQLPLHNPPGTAPLGDQTKQDKDTRRQPIHIS